jgi:hypothetical protein
MLFEAFWRFDASSLPSVVPSGLQESHPRVSSPLFSFRWRHPAFRESVLHAFECALHVFFGFRM